MDRRQMKTRQAIFQAVGRLLRTKRFEQITVQEIIDEANIGRSTFYAHFETKDELLHTMCTDIFQHVFSTALRTEDTHDFSVGHGIRGQLTHILYHLRESEPGLIGILSSDSGELFLRYFRTYLRELFCRALEGECTEIPRDYVLNHLVGSFTECVLWWIHEDLKQTPEEVSGYFFAVTAAIWTAGENQDQSPALHGSAGSFS